MKKILLIALIMPFLAYSCKKENSDRDKIIDVIVPNLTLFYLDEDNKDMLNPEKMFQNPILSYEKITAPVPKGSFNVKNEGSRNQELKISPITTKFDEAEQIHSLLFHYITIKRGETQKTAYIYINDWEAGELKFTIIKSGLTANQTIGKTYIVSKLDYNGTVIELPIIYPEITDPVKVFITKKDGKAIVSLERPK